MENIKLIKNYAKAIFETAFDRDREEVVFKQLKIIIQAINSSDEIRGALYSPIVHKTVKVSLIMKLVKSLNVEEIIKDFLLILVRNARESILSHIVDYYEQFLDESKNIKIVKVTSSKTLKTEEKEKVKNYLESDLIKQKAEIKFDEDQSIIGGILIEYDSNMIDFSIAGALKKIGDVSRKVSST